MPNGVDDGPVPPSAPLTLTSSERTREQDDVGFEFGSDAVAEGQVVDEIDEETGTTKGGSEGLEGPEVALKRSATLDPRPRVNRNLAGTFTSVVSSEGEEALLLNL